VLSRASLPDELLVEGIEGDGMPLLELDELLLELDELLLELDELLLELDELLLELLLEEDEGGRVTDGVDG